MPVASTFQSSSGQATDATGIFSSSTTIQANGMNGKETRLEVHRPRAACISELMWVTSNVPPDQRRRQNLVNVQ